MSLVDGFILGFVLLVIVLLSYFLYRNHQAGGQCASCRVSTTRRYTNKKQQTNFIRDYRKIYPKED